MYEEKIKGAEMGPATPSTTEKGKEKKEGEMAGVKGKVVEKEESK